MINIKRRRFIQRMSSGLAMLGLGFLPVSCGGSSKTTKNSTRILVPEGTTPRIIAQSGFRVLPDNPDYWISAPDGAGTVALDDGGWIYVCNSELNAKGGVSAIRFDNKGDIIDSYPILENSRRNCSGNMTPWGTWLSCEEVPDGVVWECDPLGVEPAKKRPALGLFAHESVLVDPVTTEMYLTEDKPNGRFYRFTPDTLDAGSEQITEKGQLAVARVINGLVDWLPIDDPSGASLPTRYQQSESQAFEGGEGICYFDGMIYFTTKGDNRIWTFNTRSNLLEVFAEADGIVHSVDDIVSTNSGNLLVAEDGTNMRITLFPANKQSPKTIMQLPDHKSSEVTGLAFNPSQTRLYFNSQRGVSGDSEDGISFELLGDFNNLELDKPLVEWILDYETI